MRHMTLRWLCASTLAGLCCGVDVCKLDSCPIVRAAARCARKNNQECGGEGACQWACDSGSEVICCRPTAETFDEILQRQHLDRVCRELPDHESCTGDATSSACSWDSSAGSACAVNERGRLLRPQRISWTFTTVDADNLTLTGGPWPRSLIDEYNSVHVVEGRVPESWLSQRIASSSAQHLHASLECVVHSSPSLCSGDCAWVSTSDGGSSCVLSPEGAVKKCETLEAKLCAGESTGLLLKIGAYTAFLMFLASAIASDLHLHGPDAKDELLGILMERAVAIGGLALFIFLYTLAFLHRSCVDFENISGLVITVVGLTIFSRGLSTGLMPLAENVGRELPGMIPLPPMLVVIFLLGVLCTIAEPSIQALQLAGEPVDFNEAPFLKIVLSSDYVPAPGEAAQDWVFVLKIMVGLGVGIASVIGSLRLVFSHGMKKYAGAAFLPAIILTLIACLFFATAPEHLHRSTGLAWDCGAVTTGPVTVPIVLAMGIGMASAAKSKSGLGRSPSVEQNVESTGDLHTEEQPKQEQPRMVAFEIEQVQSLTSETSDEPNLDGFGIVTFASLLPCMTVWILTFVTMVMFKVDVELATIDDPYCPRLTDLSGLTGSSGEFADILQPDPPFWCSFISAVSGSCQAVFPLVGFLFLVQFLLVRRIPPGFLEIVCGCVVTLVGMICFDIGLTTSLEPIGNKVGQLMPSAEVHYGTFGGDVVMLLFGFLAGVGATFSEPALSALGDAVQTLTKGKFKKSALISAVALGVGVGIVIGLAKIRWQLPLWIILLFGYSAAFALTAVSEEAITCVAWDSAGVTTGPVTVPIVLAVGESIASANQVAEGFGILACASFGPIIAVLAFGKIQAMSAKS